MSSDQDSLYRALLEAMTLKRVPRAGWLRVGVDRPESVAAHSWGVAWLVLNLCPPDVDRARAIEIALVHDVSEAITGDITPHDGVSPDVKQRLERDALDTLTSKMPRRDHLMSCWEEYDSAATAEGRFVKLCDKLDMALQAAVYRSEGIDTEEFIRSAMKTLTDTELAWLVPTPERRTK